MSETMVGSKPFLNQKRQPTFFLGRAIMKPSLLPSTGEVGFRCFWPGLYFVGLGLVYSNFPSFDGRGLFGLFPPLNLGSIDVARL